MSTDSDLSSILPFDAITAYFSAQVAREELRKPDFAGICRECPSEIFSLGVNCGFRAKQVYAPELDLTPLVPDIQSRSPSIVQSLSAVLGQDAIADIYCCRCSLDGMLVAALLAAEVWPNDLYIGLVKFFDPSKPVPKHERKSVLQEYKGLGLLGEFFRRTESCAKIRGCSHVTLVANETSLMDLFTSYGFAVDSYAAAQQQAKSGRAIPMHKSVA